ncbi:hypothetical protein AAG570_010310 [Ranatra chinensis]|uniref:Kelch-like protein diablo n=1 Tax=Ranatra chinensis TaxID=642074 RepID=A0ABD0YM90_9HEMI
MAPVKSKSVGSLGEGLCTQYKYDLVLSSAKACKPEDKVYFSRSHAHTMLHNLNLLRNNSRFCDVEIVAGGKVLKAHRSVLSASSPYFQAMFSNGLVEEQKDRIEIHYIEPHILTTIIDFIYTGEMTITQENVQDLIVAADMLELKEVVSGCTEFLKNELHITNAIGIYRFAEDHNCVDLAKKAANFIECHYSMIFLEEEFCELPKDPFCKFLDSEQLRVDSEYQVFQSVMRWINHDLSSRKRYVFELLSHLRLPLVSVCLLDHAIDDCTDGSLRLALRSVRKDLVMKKGNLVPLFAYPRLCARKNVFVIGGIKRELVSAWTRPLECTYESVEMFDTFRREWCRGISPMSIGRILPGVAALNGKIYVVGGEYECCILASGEVYDPMTNTWSKIASMVVPRCEFGLCVVDGDLYALGGFVGEDIGGSIEKYDSILDEWCLQGELPEPRFSMGVVSYEGLIYIVGGCTHRRRHIEDLLCLNPVTGEVKSLAPMHEPRSQIGVAILEGYLYVVGGINRDHVGLRAVERYSFEQDKWSYICSLKTGRASPAVASAAGCLYVMGGNLTHEVNFYRAQVTITSVEMYDPVRNVWDEVPALPESRSEAAAIVL